MACYGTFQTNFCEKIHPHPIRGFQEAQDMNAEPQTRCITKLVREGDLAADVDVLVVDRDDLFEEGPYLPSEEAKKLDAVRRALRNGDIRAASRLARRVYALKPVDAEE
ncbi:hypothetical protein [Thermopetrobacter sp. TC1]|uniref:hypothetical protein n=1 Tax=Thermopetrobacter sp. TC1 TaxID=1495045 RepID=UPI001E54C55D|nr:hypothetical protein [Thermopetrobacter sp. TC1]